MDTIDVDFKFSPLKFELLRFPSMRQLRGVIGAPGVGAWQISGVTEEDGFIQS